MFSVCVWGGLTLKTRKGLESIFSLIWQWCSSGFCGLCFLYHRRISSTMTGWSLSPLRTCAGCRLTQHTKRATQVKARQDLRCGSGHGAMELSVVGIWQLLASRKSAFFKGAEVFQPHFRGGPTPRSSYQHKTNSIVFGETFCFILLYFISHFCLIGLCLFWFLFFCVLQVLFASFYCFERDE